MFNQVTHKRLGSEFLRQDAQLSKPTEQDPEQAGTGWTWRAHGSCVINQQDAKRRSEHIRSFSNLESIMKATRIIYNYIILYIICYVSWFCSVVVNNIEHYRQCIHYVILCYIIVSTQNHLKSVLHNCMAEFFCDLSDPTGMSCRKVVSNVEPEEGLGEVEAWPLGDCYVARFLSKRHEDERTCKNYSNTLMKMAIMSFLNGNWMSCPSNLRLEFLIPSVFLVKLMTYMCRPRRSCLWSSLSTYFMIIIVMAVWGPKNMHQVACFRSNS